MPLATVTAVNDAPVAVDDAATTPEDTPVSGNVLTNDTDTENNSLTVTGYTIAGVTGTFNAGQTATIPNVGHWLHAENPKLFFEETARFLTNEKS